MRFLRRHLTYANVAATLALLLAIAGGTTALAGGSKAPKNSVTSKSIRSGNVTANDLSTIVSRSATLQVTDQTPNDGNYGTGAATATCPTGARVISGSVISGGSGAVAVTSSAATSNGWTGTVSSDVGGTLTGSVNVRCLIRRPGSPQG
jgi:hypothetical protein